MYPHVVHIDTRRIVDAESFHDVFHEVLGFPAYYGRNMDAWIDCMTYLDDPDCGMTTIHVPTGSVLVLALDHVDGFRNRCRDLFDGLVGCAAFVNYRRIESGDGPALALAFHQ